MSRAGATHPAGLLMAGAGLCGWALSHQQTGFVAPSAGPGDIRPSAESGARASAAAGTSGARAARAAMAGTAAAVAAGLGAGTRRPRGTAAPAGSAVCRGAWLQSVLEGLKGSSVSDGTPKVTQEEVLAAQQAWGDALVRISTLYDEQGYEVAKALAEQVIDGAYGYQYGPVLFKPTLASGKQTFRTTREGALAYFVGGNPAFPGDTGFALRGWRKVEIENAAIFREGNSGTSIGNVIFTDKNGKVTIVDKSWKFFQGTDGKLRIVAHHSSLPYEAPSDFPTPKVSEEEVLAAQKGWGDALVKIASVYDDQGHAAAKALAEQVIDEAYGYQYGPVLFKPTLASGKQTFRTTRDGALAYFVGGDPAYPADTGFALRGWRKVEIENAAVFREGNTGTSVGNVLFTDKAGKVTKVDKTWKFYKGVDGKLRIVAHHSSLPYVPPSDVTPNVSEDEVLAAQQGWGDALVKIATTYEEQGHAAAKALAEQVIDAAYGYQYGPVLFKPTLASGKQTFRTTREGALAYFVGGSPAYPGDTGFALNGWRKVQIKNAAVFREGNTGTSVGNVVFTDKDGKVTVVDKTWKFYKGSDGRLRIVAHHSSLPYVTPEEAAKPKVSEAEVLAAQRGWGDALVKISKTFDEEGHAAAKALAEQVIDEAYGYQDGPVLFKPTLASGKQTFRTTREGALAYFVGGSPAYPDDTGFALKSWRKVEIENAAIFREGKTGTSTGNVIFTDKGGNITKVDKTWKFCKGGDGKLRIVAHHSSLPYQPVSEPVPSVSEDEVLAAQRGWGEALVKIATTFDEEGFEAAKSLAEQVIDEAYGYQQGVVLFKPTLASGKQTFRTTREGALAYFVGGNPAFPSDTGFALRGWRQVEIKNAAIFRHGNTGTTVGNVIFTDKDGSVTVVDKTWTFMKGADGKLRIVAHHSSLPYVQTTRVLPGSPVTAAPDAVLNVTEAEVIAAQRGWGDALVKIATTFDEQGHEAAKALAEAVIDAAYGYQYGPVLFKPTLASGEQTFRTTREGALAYFVGGNPAYPGDTGFALRGWRSVEVENAAIFLEGNSGTSMGNVIFTDKAGAITKVDKTWKFFKGGDGKLRIVTHHSSLPYMPASEAAPNVSEDEVLSAQRAWADALVNISTTFDEQGHEAAKALAEAVIDAAYGYQYGPVLFKPTLASGKQTFRTTREGALAYFVGGNAAFPGDTGFALKGWRKVEIENAAIFREGSTGTSVGNVIFTDKDGNVTKVDKTWKFYKGADAKLRIVAHHSSLPYVPADQATPSVSEDEVLAAQRGWGDALVKIATTFEEKGHAAAKALAAQVIDEAYGYQYGPVLFKPTLASGKQTFRTTREGALAYFVGGNPAYPGDAGFALNGWRKVEIENAAIFREGNTGTTLGHVIFTDKTGKVTLVDKSWKFYKGADGKLRIVAHHSSLPYKPASELVPSVTEDEVLAAQRGWGDALVKIATTFDEQGHEAAKALAEQVIDEAYGYQYGQVLFKPTLASGEQTFRTTREGALAYFVGGNSAYPGDTGFALKGWRNVEVENAAIFREGKTGTTVGNVIFTDKDGNVTKVDKTWKFYKGADGRLRIVAHHSSLPYQPASEPVPSVSEEEVLAAQRGWGDALVNIATTFDEQGFEAAKALAAQVIDEAYGYQQGPVLFKPTLASGKQTFRTTREGALAYFVGGNPAFPSDTGFALRGWRKVEIKNAAIFRHGNTGSTVGNVIFTDKEGAVTLVDKTWNFMKGADGKLRIVAHHSSLPYVQPAATVAQPAIETSAREPASAAPVTSAARSEAPTHKSASSPLARAQATQATRATHATQARPVSASAPSLGEESDLSPLPLPLGEVQVDSAMMGYQQFVPRLYNLCKELGMTPGLIQPSIGFCADENQGYPTIIITKHFGCYPFNHGYIGGIMALDRHGPHAAHGEDMAIIHAPHVGYDPATGRYGVYRRKQVRDPSQQMSSNCGKMAGVLQFYKEEYGRALGDVEVRVDGDKVLVAISQTILQHGTDGSSNGLRVHFEHLLADPSLSSTHSVRSTSKVFEASPAFAALVKEALAAAPAPSAVNEIQGLAGAQERRAWRSLQEPSLRGLLQPRMFSFSRPAGSLEGERHRLERELLPHLPVILAGPWDAELTAALTCAQFEFERSVHSVSAEPAYKGRNLLLISGLNIDISPDADGEAGQAYAFPSTMFLPWSAYVQLADGRRRVLEQADLVRALFAQSEKNPDAIDIEASIAKLFGRTRKRVTFYDASSGVEQAAKVL